MLFLFVFFILFIRLLYILRSILYYSFAFFHYKGSSVLCDRWSIETCPNDRTHLTLLYTFISISFTPFNLEVLEVGMLLKMECV